MLGIYDGSITDAMAEKNRGLINSLTVGW